MHAVEYDQVNLNLTVYFKSGAIYDYYPFYENQYADFLKADSKGSWFTKNVKNNKSIRFKKK